MQAEAALGRVDLIRAGRRASIFDDADVPVPVVEERVDKTARQVVRCERDRQQPFFPFTSDKGAQIEERILLRHTIFDQSDQTVLVHDHQARRTSGGPATNVSASVLPCTSVSFTFGSFSVAVGDVTTRRAVNVRPRTPATGVDRSTFVWGLVNRRLIVTERPGRTRVTRDFRRS